MITIINDFSLNFLFEIYLLIPFLVPNARNCGMLWNTSPAICVALKISFVRLPNGEEERIFRENMVIRDVDSHSLDELSNIIEKKLAFIEYPLSDFTIFYKEDSGDRIVVDHSYYSRLVNHWSKLKPQAYDDYILETQQSFVDNGGCSIPVNFSIEVELRKRNNNSIPPDANGKSVAPLTVENLAKIKHNSLTLLDQDPQKKESSSESAPYLIPIKDLSCPPSHQDFYIRGVVVSIRCKTARTGIEVVEVDFCDPSDPAIEITAMSFDSTVRKAIKDNLRCDRRQVVELYRVYIRKKNDVDVRYQSNRHPLLLRLDRYSRIEVIQILTIPLPPKVQESIVTVRQKMLSGGPVDFAALVAGNEVLSQKNPSYPSGRSDASSLSSSALSGSQRRTTFSLNMMPSRTSQSKVTPSPLLVEEKNIVDFHLREPGVIHTSKKDVQARERTVAEYAAHEEHRKDYVRRKVEASSQCLLCGLDLQNEEVCLSIVRRLLDANTSNRGSKFPTIDELKIALSDARWVSRRSSSTPRLLSKATFVNLDKRTVHRVHCRCAHLCTSYQLGKNIEDIVSCELPFNICSLCSISGATVSCYHPDCREQYHVICAIYSSGYVNFGKKDPHKPCPACPRHTQVPISFNSKEPAVLHEDSSCWEDSIAFDSRVVESTDLRDPDENDGL